MSESATPIVNAAEAMPRGVSLWQDAWVRLKKNRLAMIGLFILAFVIIVCALAPWIMPYG